jgi:hypothetical protein
MEFGLLPKFSTPVEKAVENAPFGRSSPGKGLILRDFLEAKGLQSRYERLFGGTRSVLQGDFGRR